MRCIYKIDINGRYYYIGSAKDFENRKRLHLAKLKTNTHPNKYIQNIYNKYGADVFKFNILEKIDEGVELFDVEQSYLDEHCGKDGCVNLASIAGGGYIGEHTPERIDKMLETRRKNGNWYAAVRYPKEAIEANKGSKRTKEFCKNMSEIKKDLYGNNKDKAKEFHEAGEMGRKIRWEKHLKPFILEKNGKTFGPYKRQRDVWESGILSNVGISWLFSGKREKVKGYSLRFIEDVNIWRKIALQS